MPAVRAVSYYEAFHLNLREGRLHDDETAPFTDPGLQARGSVQYGLDRDLAGWVAEEVGAYQCGEWGSISDIRVGTVSDRPGDAAAFRAALG